MVKKYVFREVMTFEEAKKLEGEYIDYFTPSNVIDHDADVYIEKNGKTEILFHFRKNVIPDELLQEAILSFKKDAKRATSVRGASGGKVNLDKLSANVKNVVNTNAFRSKIVYKDGHVSNYYVSNKAPSMIAGYFDKSKVSERHDVLLNNKLPCRTTAFTEKNTEKWKRVLPLIELADDYYKYLEPDIHNEQYNVLKSTPQYQINNTAFSTITVNYNWRTANHIDSGDYHNGLSVIMCATEGKFEGGYLGYPQYDVCVDVRHGDLLLKNPHQWHCNTKITGITKDWTRLSMVLYYREGLYKCRGGTSTHTSTSKDKSKGTDTGKDISREYISNLKEINSLKNINLERINFDGYNIYIRPDTTDIKVIDEVLKKKVYKKLKIDFDVENDEVWFDLGGNIGTFSLYALNKGAKTIIYEPEPENLIILKKNLYENFESNNYKIIPSAISSIEGTFDLFLCKGDYNKYRHTLYKKRGRTSIKVNVLNFHNEMDKYKPDGIKIDIEGSEIDILESIKLVDWIKWETKKLVFEYSFDIDKSIKRFMNIINNLKKYWDIVYYTKVKEDEIEYNYFPAMTMVYCIKL